MFCKQLLSLFGFETQFRASMAANFHYVNRSRVYLRFRNSNEIELLIFRLCNLSCYNLAAWNKPKKAYVMTSPGIPRYLIHIYRIRNQLRFQKRHRKIGSSSTLNWSVSVMPLDLLRGTI